MSSGAEQESSSQPETGGSDYRTFVKQFMNKALSENPGSCPKEAMRKCGQAWKLHKKDGHASNAANSVRGVGKTKERHRVAIKLPSAPSGINDVVNYFASIREEGQTSPRFSRSVAIAIPRTKQVHRQLKNSVRNFMSTVKAGSVPNMEHAFVSGFNALLQLAQG